MPRGHRGLRGRPTRNPIQDQEYFLIHKDELMVSHAGEFVAVRGGKIVGTASTRRQLEEDLKTRFGGDVYAFVRLVCEEAFEMPTDECIIIS